jgi:uncharacterized RDD family membrane protein YckC
LRETPGVASSTPVALGRPLAGWWTRGGALLIDVMVQAAIEILLLLVVWWIDGRPVLTVQETEMVLFVVGLPVVIIYAPLLLARPGAHNGQTVGKQAMGIRVVRENGQPVTIPSAIVRETLGRQLISLVTYGLYLLPDYLWPLRDSRNQALHDKIARTFVVAARGSVPVFAEPGESTPARRWGAPEGNGRLPPEQSIRGEWLPPVAPKPGDPD